MASASLGLRSTGARRAHTGSSSAPLTSAVSTL